jgi:hypothetical protein
MKNNRVSCKQTVDLPHCADYTGKVKSAERERTEQRGHEMLTKEQKRAAKYDYLTNNAKHSAGLYWTREMDNAAHWRKRFGTAKRDDEPLSVFLHVRADLANEARYHLERAATLRSPVETLARSESILKTQGRFHVEPGHREPHDCRAWLFCDACTASL